MKTLIIALFMLFTTTHSDFCHGWERGYAEGYCYNENYCISPIPPVCPFPYINENQYIDGYNRGFTEGLKDGK